MVEPRCVTKEELIRRQEIIDKSRDELKKLRDERLEYCKKGNVYRVKEIDDRVNYYCFDITQSEKLLKKDRSDFNVYNRWQKQKELQERTLPFATKNNEDYVDEEYIQLVNCTQDDDEMLNLALKMKRTFYGIRWMVGIKETYLKTHQMPKWVEEGLAEDYKKIIDKICN